ncbi:DUF4870 domain-containing protein [Salinimicrobium soli]|uniref:DUF4870 domain-containing protein n=1 Tax=Salinimicrobium soli TaxID=1254399 RepID=UPI003AAF456F
MTTEVTNPDKTVAAFIHLSTFSCVFLPFGNFILPLIFWTAKKNDPFVNEHGKQALNFQISLFLYFVFLLVLGVAGVILIGLNLSIDEPFYFNDHFMQVGSPREAMPMIIYALVMGFFILALVALDIYAVISATIKAGEGELYKYPLTINFLTPASSSGSNQSKNEQFNNTQNQTL